MKIAVVGSRKFKKEIFVKEKVNQICERLSSMKSPLTIVSGGAKGVDSWAEEIADMWKALGVIKRIFKADWDDLSQSDAIIKTNKFGKKYDARAGIRRNQLIVDEADKIIAFWDGRSSGTKSSIDMAIQAGKPVDIYIR